MNKLIAYFQQHPWLRSVLLLLTGIFLGWLVFGGPDTQNKDRHDRHVHATTNEVWTCSMHPQIRQNEPGSCPICGMDLIPLADAGGEMLDADQLQMTMGAARLADIQTTTVTRSVAEKNLSLSGQIVPDETRISRLTARFPGRIEQLFVNYTGQYVRRGEKLATVYSPELISAQKELFEAIKLREHSPSLYQAARSKLRLWDLTDAQIESIEESGEPRLHFDILSPLSGTVTQREVTTGDYLSAGKALFEITDLSRLWVMFDAYEQDLPWINVGDKVHFSVAALPGESFDNQISFIEPVIDPTTRVAKVRVQIANRSGRLKPEMFVRGTITATLPDLGDPILVPKSAVLWTGDRAIVYVKEPEFEEPTFSFREIQLGQETGGLYVVTEGLREGEEVVTNGAFKIDAAAQLQGKRSMMNPEPVMAPPHPEEVARLEASPAFRQQLAQVLSAYQVLNQALIDSDPEKATPAAKQVQMALSEVNMELLSGNAHKQWMAQLNLIRQSLESIQSSTSLDDQRRAYATLSQGLYQAVSTFGASDTLYWQYCPMAIGNKGAYWLSPQSDILNPYFGETMLKCGETRETISPGE